MKVIQMNKQLREYMREIHTLLDSINLMLLDEFKSLMNLDLTGKQWFVLTLLHKQGKLTVNELAQALAVTPSAVSQLLRKLQEEEYIHRETNPANRRETFVCLHSKGKTLFQEVERMEEMLAEKYYSKLELAEVHQLHHIVQKLHQIIASEKDRKH